MQHSIAVTLIVLLLVSPVMAGLQISSANGIVMTGADGIVMTGADGIVLTGADGLLPGALCPAASGLQSVDPELAVQLN